MVGADIELGQQQRIKILAYARDEFVQTILIAQYPADGTTNITMSAFEYPAILLSHTNDTSLSNYAAITAGNYSNHLWSRLITNGIIAVTRESVAPLSSATAYSRITHVKLTASEAIPGDDQVTVLLPKTTSDPSTTVRVVLVNESKLKELNIQNLTATLCIVSAWLNDKCTPVSPIPMNEPLEGRFSHSDALVLKSGFIENPCSVGWDSIPIADHTTIHYMPPHPENYAKALGKEQHYEMLAYARDEHVSAVLLRVVRPNATTVYTTNAFPHSTVRAMQLDGAYGAVYSNYLWLRLTNASILAVDRDENGRIESARFVARSNDTQEVVTQLPGWHLDGKIYYPPSQVYVKLLASSQVSELVGVVCSSLDWDDKMRVCTTPTNDTPSSSDNNLGLALGLGLGFGALVLIGAFYWYCKTRRSSHRDYQDFGSR